MEFSPATVDDVEAIRSVARESWENDYPDIVSRESLAEGFEEWYAPEKLTQELRENDVTILLAVDSDVVGFAHAVVSEGIGNVLRLYVRPAYRDRGVGRELLERTADRLVEEGADHLRAMVLEENEAGRAFYRAVGFESVGNAATIIGSETREELTFERPIRTPVESM